MPVFFCEKIQCIVFNNRGSSDYFGLNHYSTYLATKVPKVQGKPWFQDKGFIVTPMPGWPGTDIPDFKACNYFLPNDEFSVSQTINNEYYLNYSFQIVPNGFRKLLVKIRDEYKNPRVFITENGMAESVQFTDTTRLEFLHSYLEEMLTAIQIEECNIVRYTYWSLLDNFQWDSGYRYDIIIY